MPNVKFYSTDWAQEIDAYSDLGVTLQPVMRSLPAVKTNYQAIAGRDGDVDLTEVDGEVHFDNRVDTLFFKRLDPSRSWAQLSTLLANKLHGKRFFVVFEDEEDVYYDARMSMTSLSPEENVSTIELRMTAFPYKLKRELTTESSAVAGTVEMTLTNARMSTFPQVIVEGGQMTIEWNGAQIVLAEGTYNKRYDMKLKEGDTVISVTGDGNITFNWREGLL
ncbi:MAG: hypothetical protein ACOX3W_00410 [Christensenellaceae bacterium]|jgi:phage-related protein